MDQFKYLGLVISQNNDIKAETSMRLQSGNKCFYGLSKILRSKTISRNVKFRMYLTLLRPINLYEAETWSLKKAEERRMAVFERKILRKIYGAHLMSRQISGGNYTTMSCNHFFTKYSKRKLKKKTDLDRIYMEKAWITDKKSNRGKPGREATSWKTMFKMGKLS